MTTNANRYAIDRLIELLGQEGDNIENLLIAYSVKGRPTGIAVGNTPGASALWMLGALDHVRWHVYDMITRDRLRQTEEQQAAEVVAQALKDDGRLQ